jgi:hypothetical protein
LRVVQQAFQNARMDGARGKEKDNAETQSSQSQRREERWNWGT